MPKRHDEELNYLSTKYFLFVALSFKKMNQTIDSFGDDPNGSLIDDWENYKGYTKFFYATDEVFLYANPILILIGESSFSLNKNKSNFFIVVLLFATQEFRLMHFR